MSYVSGNPAVGNGEFVISGAIATVSDVAKRLYGLLGMNMDPLAEGARNIVTLTAGTVYFSKIPLAGSATSTVSVTNVCISLDTIATSTLTHAFSGVLTSAGVLVGMTADNASANANWSSTGAAGFKSMALVGGPFTVTPTGIDDFVYAVSYIGTTAGTAPKFSATAVNTASANNLGLTAATSRCSTQAVGDSATPFASITMASNVAASQAVWQGIS